MPRSERLGSGPQEQAGSSNRDAIFRFCDPGLIDRGVIKNHLFMIFSRFLRVANRPFSQGNKDLRFSLAYLHRFAREQAKSVSLDRITTTEE